MKAMIVRKFGGPENFELADMPKPKPGFGQVLVKVHAASVNPVDFKLRQYNWVGLPVPCILGYDASGVIEETGPGVSGLKSGDEVWYSAKIFGRQGTYAEYHVEDADIVLLKPKNLSFEEAASIPLAGCTAWDCVITHLGIKPGASILIHAGAGGVGSLAVQIARAAGAWVVATCKTENESMVRSLGAHEIIDYKAGKFEEQAARCNNGKLFDAVFDTVGGDTIARSIGITKNYGHLATCVSVEGKIDNLIMRNQTLHGEFMERSAVKLGSLANLVEQGLLKAVIDSVYPLDKVADAHRKIENGGMKGKLVIKIF
jgi:NADPH:quinone reductase